MFNRFLVICVCSLSLSNTFAAPLIIGHRGASGVLPEHTLEAYKLAVEQGADFIEPDLVSTKDHHLIARHEPLLDNTTNVTDLPQFAHKKSKKVIDGKTIEGYLASDFTLEEIKSMRARQPRKYRSSAYDDQFKIPTLDEIISLVIELQKTQGRKVGIYPETKHPTFHRGLGISIEEPLIASLEKYKFTDPSRVFIQSFEVSNLKTILHLTHV